MAQTDRQSAPIPKLRVQRQGKKWRIVYEDTRGLARFNNGEPVDDGGFEDLWQGTEKTVDGQFECMKKLSAVLSGQSTEDPEAENIGP